MILFNPAARVWNLRFASLWTICLTVYVAWPDLEHHFPFKAVRALAIMACCLIFLHHVLVLVPCRFQGLALIDLCLILLEGVGIAGIAYSIWTADLDPGRMVMAGVGFFPPLLSLILSALFRIATITKSKEGIVHQRFAFLGSCTRTHPPYTPLSILLNRSIARPLVRGEARCIIFARAFILSVIALGLPAFAIYAIIITPKFTTQIYTRAIDWIHMPLESGPMGNVAILLSPFVINDYFLDPINITAYGLEVHATTLKAEEFNCTTISDADRIAPLIECPCPWKRIASVSISLSIPQGIPGVVVTPVQGGLSPADWSEAGRLTGASLAGVPLFPGSRITGLFTWIRMDMIETIVWGISSPRTTFYAPSVTGLQTHPPATSASDVTSTLTLFQRSWEPTRLLQDTADATALSGISTFGGFWTFLNGAFALFFGANVLYFLFGRRPLSALGLVHVFQRRQLARQWHEDFPAIHTEGGRPGVESAGIVAFIRERLVDLGEDPQRETPEDRRDSDVEAQKSAVAGGGGDGTCVHVPAREPLRHQRSRTDSETTGLEPAHVLDEISMLDYEDSERLSSDITPGGLERRKRA